MFDLFAISSKSRAVVLHFIRKIFPSSNSSFNSKERTIFVVAHSSVYCQLALGQRNFISVPQLPTPLKRGFPQDES